MIRDLLMMGGPITWLIVISGVVAFVVFIERSLHLHRARIRADDFLKGIFNILQRGNISEALTICEETPGPVAHLARMAILHRQEGRESLRTVMADTGQAEVSRLERRLVAIATIAQVAPLMGLLGTILGLVEYGMALQQAIPLVEAPRVMQGLMAAMTSTAAGLTVAIPCYVGFNLLVVKIDRLVLDMERAASEVLAFFTTSQPVPGAP
ncbi:MAG: hypothetical protein A2498_09585 [Lentisphaerae bacterium RIFOXYC12_FULL_60_16]|nr:MAG: hypothetical protein A2498_09585 [Lentisphaerae bacterium RIFOXYC12_FULL_60_16]OGV72092.1 MAG: hypothetical protein A2269_00120 [Lentisphaerae bacterium RIFOXYA12_FULL_60_10]OGV86843.1 MAG: hypothetical protein A2340_14150 [Lentisphaerae bacterium RIFOXYB12_FULL_60_10]